jgi:hypothetical protein
MTDKDPRRWGVIETRFRPGPPQIYQLTIGGQLWAVVEWSPSRRTWCIEDAAGHCLAHCEHVHGEHIDQPTALALAKAMIRDGRVPTPEEAERRLAFQGPGERDVPVQKSDEALVAARGGARDDRPSDPGDQHREWPHRSR